MDPLTSLIFMALICVGLAMWLFMLYSKNKNLLRYGSCLRACLNNPNWPLRVAILRVNTFKIA